MTEGAYYNEIDPYCCEWLELLMFMGLIPEGRVDSRPVQKVKPEEIKGYAQVHLFAGMGGWPCALRMAGWPDERGIWTGSCPCQPFSVAGKGGGTKDRRHLWPHMYRLVRGGRPAVVMGEQVAGKAGYAWFDGVGADLEKEGYEGRAVDIPACGVNAPHIRNRVYWIARDGGVSHAQGIGWKEECEDGGEGAGGDQEEGRASGFDTGGVGGLSYSQCDGWGQGSKVFCAGQSESSIHGQEPDSRVPYSNRPRPQERPSLSRHARPQLQTIERSNHWDDYHLIGPDRDGKYRRIKPGLRPLAHGVRSRVAKLRALGNSIVPPLACEVIKAYMEAYPA